MTLFDAMNFFRTLGTSWHDPHLESTVRTQEADRWREAEETIGNPHAYSILTLENGSVLAQEAIRLYDARNDNTDHIPHTVLMQLAKHVPGALRHCYRDIVERQLYWGDGITFREADTETCKLLIHLLGTALPGGSRTRAVLLQALAWAEDAIALEAFSESIPNRVLTGQSSPAHKETLVRLFCLSWERFHHSKEKPFCLDTFPFHGVRLFPVVSLYTRARHLRWR